MTAIILGYHEIWWILNVSQVKLFASVVGIGK